MAATGQPIARKQTVTAEIDLQQWSGSPLVRIDEAGQIRIDLTETIHLDKQGEISSGYNWAAVFPELDAMPSSGLNALEMAAERLASKQAKLRQQYEGDRARQKTQEREATLAVLRERRTKTDSNLAGRVKYSYAIADWPYYSDQEIRESEEARAWEKELAEQRESSKARAIEQARQEAEQDAAKEKAKKEYIDDWMELHADEALRQQHHDGFLSRKRALEAIANRAFDDIGLPAEFHYDNKFCRNPECPCGEQTLTTIPPHIYSSWLALKAKLPEETLKAKLPEETAFEFRVVREHIDWDELNSDDSSSAGPKQYFAVVHLTVGPFVFDRKLELGEERA